MAKSPAKHYASSNSTGSSAKKRKSKEGTTRATRDLSQGEALGTVSIPVLAHIQVRADLVSFDEAVIEWGCLGLSEEPDQVKEVSGNANLLDVDRPITTSEEGLHVFFKPPLTGGIYGFQFQFVYFDAITARTADPVAVEKREKDRAEHEQQESAA